ncbi:uncharacterized protein HGUI_00789 [Hanseniaspora guilliermondii]|uniref:DNA2/NAM7 helicase helicase domain-containing protein n=1 Tax=Hanseniaspora guilliermondii TaxID=56406 RepID=A0A1L0CIJ1_9ASCO|nr:uncharacterized protein HGUI_00789 [Hanseniaspora guilliermondii]
MKSLEINYKVSNKKKIEVSIDPFDETILEWNYDRTGDYPDDGFKFENTKQQYSSIKEYQKIMRPLLLLETWQQVIQAKAPGCSTYPIRIDVENYVYEEQFLIIHTTVSSDSLEQSGLICSDLCGIGMGTSALISSMPKTFKSFELLDRVNYAKIHSVKEKKDNRFKLEIKISAMSRIARILYVEATLFLTKVTSLTAYKREYTALFGLNKYDLLNDIMVPKNYNISQTINVGDVSEIKSEYDANQSQAEAIACVTASPGISLIQGPPGTGKSKTIVSMMKFFFDEKNKTKVANFPEFSASKKRILLCAPSNAAIDDLLLRLSVATDLKLVRIGRKEAISSKVYHLELEEIINKKLHDLVSELFDYNKYRQEIQKRNKLEDKLRLLKNDKHYNNNSENDKTINALTDQLNQCNKTLLKMREEKAEKENSTKKIRESYEIKKKKLVKTIL